MIRKIAHEELKGGYTMGRKIISEAEPVQKVILQLLFDDLRRLARPEGSKYKRNPKR